MMMCILFLVTSFYSNMKGLLCVNKMLFFGCGWYGYGFLEAFQTPLYLPALHPIRNISLYYKELSGLKKKFRILEVKLIPYQFPQKNRDFEYYHSNLSKQNNNLIGLCLARAHKSQTFIIYFAQNILQS